MKLERDSSYIIIREGLKAKKRVTGLVLAVILSFVGELQIHLDEHHSLVDHDGAGGVDVNDDDH